MHEAYLEAGRPKEAIPHFKAALSLDQNGALYYDLARAYQQAGQTDLAQKMIERARAIRLAQEEIKLLPHQLEPPTPLPQRSLRPQTTRPPRISDRKFQISNRGKLLTSLPGFFTNARTTKPRLTFATNGIRISYRALFLFEYGRKKREFMCFNAETAGRL